MAAGARPGRTRIRGAYARSVTTPPVRSRDYAMRAGWRAVILWVPIAWLVVIVGACVQSLIFSSGHGFLFWSPLFILYGLAFVWLSRMQVVTVQVRDDDIIHFVARARVIPIYLDDLVEIAPARGILQHRIATRFRTQRVRVTVLSRLFRDFDSLVAEVEQRSKARVVRY